MPIYVELVFYTFKGDVIEIVFNDIVELSSHHHHQRKENHCDQSEGTREILQLTSHMLLGEL